MLSNQGVGRIPFQGLKVQQRTGLQQPTQTRAYYLSKDVELQIERFILCVCA